MIGYYPGNYPDRLPAVGPEGWLFLLVLALVIIGLWLFLDLARGGVLRPRLASFQKPWTVPVAVVGWLISLTVLGRCSYPTSGFLLVLLALVPLTVVCLVASLGGRFLWHGQPGLKEPFWVRLLASLPALGLSVLGAAYVAWASGLAAFTWSTFITAALAALVAALTSSYAVAYLIFRRIASQRRPAMPVYADPELETWRLRVGVLAMIMMVGFIGYFTRDRLGSWAPPAPPAAKTPVTAVTPPPAPTNRVETEIIAGRLADNGDYVENACNVSHSGNTVTYGNCQIKVTSREGKVIGTRGASILDTAVAHDGRVFGCSFINVSPNTNGLEVYDYRTGINGFRTYSNIDYEYFWMGSHFTTIYNEGRKAIWLAGLKNPKAGSQSWDVILAEAPLVDSGKAVSQVTAPIWSFTRETAPGLDPGTVAYAIKDKDSLEISWTDDSGAHKQVVPVPARSDMPFAGVSKPVPPVPAPPVSDDPNLDAARRATINLH